MTERKLIISSFNENSSERKYIASALFSYAVQNKYQEISLINCDTKQSFTNHIEKGIQHFKNIPLKKPVFNSKLCKYCAKCIKFCEPGAIYFNRESSYVKIFYDRCTGCGKCVKACCYNAFTEDNSTSGLMIREGIDNDNFIIDGKIENELWGGAALAEKFKELPGKFRIYNMPLEYLVNTKSFVNDKDYVVIISSCNDLEADVEDLSSIMPLDINYGIVLTCDENLISVYSEHHKQMHKRILGIIKVNGNDIILPYDIPKIYENTSAFHELLKEIIEKPSL